MAHGQLQFMPAAGVEFGCVEPYFLSVGPSFWIDVAKVGYGTVAFRAGNYGA